MEDSESLGNAARMFLRSVAKLYWKSQKRKFIGRNGKRIYRSRAKSVASDAEDLLACHLAALIPAATEIWVDVSLTSGATTVPRRIMPDIVVLHGETIVAIVDLKMDMGWNRSGEAELLERFDIWLRAAKQSRVKSGWGSECFQVHPKAKYHLAVVTEHNSGDMSKITRDSDHASLWTFADAHWHPNSTVSARPNGQMANSWTVDGKMEELGQPRPDFGKMIAAIRDVWAT